MAEEASDLLSVFRQGYAFQIQLDDRMELQEAFNYWD